MFRERPATEVTKGHGEIYGEGFGAGDTIHCEARVKGERTGPAVGGSGTKRFQQHPKPFSY